MLEILALIFLSGGSTHVSQTFEQAGQVTFIVPQGWSVERREKGPFLKRFLKNPDQSQSCDIVVVGGACAQDTSEIQNFLSQAREMWVGRAEKPAELKTPIAHFEGFMIQGAKALEPFGKAGEPTTEVYAACVGKDLVSAQFTTFAAHPKRDALRQQCIAVIQSISSPKKR